MNNLAQYGRNFLSIPQSKQALVTNAFGYTYGHPSFMKVVPWLQQFLIETA